jgi:hypothetical protein
MSGGSCQEPTKVALQIEVSQVEPYVAGYQHFTLLPSPTTGIRLGPSRKGSTPMSDNAYFSAQSK